MTKNAKKEHIKNETLTKKYQGCGALYTIIKLKMGNLKYSHCMEFGRYVRSRNLKLTIDDNYDVKEVWDIVYLPVEA
jgi:hypothetical protein